MEHQQNLDPEHAVDIESEREIASNTATRSTRRSARPSERELMDALVAHREFPTSPAQRNALGILIHRSVAHQARSLADKFFSAADSLEDELFERANKRIENKETEFGQLLAEYEIAEGSRSIYSFINEMTLNIARNMQSEMYVPDGGFRSKDLIATLQASQLERTGKKDLRSGTQVQVPIDSHEDDEDGYCGPVLPGLWISETPMRQSFIRVNSLTEKLCAMAANMVGKSVTLTQKDGAIGRPIRLTSNHQRIWLAWLGLLDSAHIDLSEDELANHLGISKPTVTRDTSAAFAYMLQHSDLREILKLMKPNSLEGHTDQSTESDTTWAALEATLRGSGGKGFFRTCVHQWLAQHL